MIDLIRLDSRSRRNPERSRKFEALACSRRSQRTMCGTKSRMETSIPQTRRVASIAPESHPNLGTASVMSPVAAAMHTTQDGSRTSGECNARQVRRHFLSGSMLPFWFTVELRESIPQTEISTDIGTDTLDNLCNPRCRQKVGRGVAGKFLAICGLANFESTDARLIVWWRVVQLGRWTLAPSEFT